jgi:hypothetical protein
MKFTALACLPLLAAQVSCTPTSGRHHHDKITEAEAVEYLADRAECEALQQVDARAAQLEAQGLKATCTRDNIVFRKE